jgi:lipopolysaccharide/colanic/teichoic acid biosynthesis glycosyltransferase
LIPAVGDLAILFATLAASFALRQPDLLKLSVFAAFLPLFLLWQAVYYAAGLYELRVVRDFVSLTGGIIASSIVCWLLGTVYFYFLTPYLQLFPKTHLTLTVLGAHAAMFAWRRTILAVLNFDLLKLRLRVLADESHLEYLRASADQKAGDGLDLAGKVDDGVDMIVTDSDWVEEHWSEARAVFSEALSRGIPIVSLESFYESLFGKVSPQSSADPSWALEHILPRAGSLYFKLKRVLDAFLAAVLLLLAAPLFAAIALLIRFGDGIAPIYGQKRVGYLGRVFVLYKFQTMRPGSDLDEAFRPVVEGADARVTPFGGVLRRFRLDELPQLWNVLKGDMSMVGPRPEWIKEVAVLERQVPNYHLRHLVHPGITGWAQVYFRATNDPRDSIEKHHYDLYYLKRFSPALDVAILLKTIKRVLIKDARVSSARTPFPSRRSIFAADIASLIKTY